MKTSRLKPADAEILLAKDVCLILENGLCSFPYLVFGELGDKLGINAGSFQLREDIGSSGGFTRTGSAKKVNDEDFRLPPNQFDSFLCG